MKVISRTKKQLTPWDAFALFGMAAAGFLALCLVYAAAVTLPFVLGA